MAVVVQGTACVTSLAVGEEVCMDCIFVVAVVVEGNLASCCLMAFLLLLEGHIQGDCVIETAAAAAAAEASRIQNQEILILNIRVEYVACENGHFSLLLSVGDVSRGGTSQQRNSI